MVLVGVLGPLQLTDPDGRGVRVASVRQRRLLAALALRTGAPVDADVLAELVWGDALPADPAGALQTNVARLRRVLPAPLVIETSSRAYRLLAAPADVDVLTFTEQVDRAAALGVEERVTVLETALALWRGRPFADLDHSAVAPEVSRLEELRATAVERRGQALLALGRPGETVAALEPLVLTAPLREGAVGLLVRALAAAGRQGDALAVYDRLRRELAEQLGLDPSPELRALHEQVLRQDLAPSPVAAPPARPRLAVSSFVGREGDLERVDAALARCRIVTLTGPGGVGKSRLARHAADRAAARYEDGIVHVELAAARPRDVVPTVAAALRLSDTASAALQDRVVEVLAARRQLLVLDDCEHVAEPAAMLVEAVTTGAPGVDVLTTSREALRADGEQVLHVAPLPAEAAQQLLADRIRSADPDAAPGAGDGVLLAAVCRRLDGLPLALELAAARVPAVGLSGLLAALDEPFALLRSGRRTAAPRHRSLHDVVQWSFDLLDETQQRLFEHMAVFAGAVEPAAVAAVCGDAELLPDLVDRSLVQRGSDPLTYGMLETLRAFGRSRLAGTAAEARLQRRHTDWAVRLADEIARDRLGPEEPAAVRRFDAHLADLRAAHARLVAAGPIDELLRLSLLLAELGFQRGRADLVVLVDRTLATAGDAAHPMLARLLGVAAQTRWQRGDLAGCAVMSGRAVAVADAVGVPEAARDAYESLANVGLLGGRLADARHHLLRCIDLARNAGDRATELMALVDLTVAAAYAGDDAAAAAHEAAAATVAAAIGSSTGRAWAAYAAGERRAERGDPSAVRYLERAVALATEVDAAFVAGVARHTLLTSAVRRETTGDAAAALPAFGPLLDHWHGLGARAQLWIAVRALTETLSRAGRHREVALILGAQQASPTATPQYGPDAVRTELAARVAAEALGGEFDALLAEGAALGDAGAVALARSLTRPPAREPGALPRESAWGGPPVLVTSPATVTCPPR